MAYSLSQPGAPTPKLEDLAREAELSLFHFTRAFRKTVGETPHAYVLRRRLELARTLLVNSSRTIGAVARRAGFKSMAHFSDRFHKEMGLTAANFRTALNS